jgi:hypothetical protein
LTPHRQQAHHQYEPAVRPSIKSQDALDYYSARNLTNVENAGELALVNTFAFNRFSLAPGLHLPSTNLMHVSERHRIQDSVSAGSRDEWNRKRETLSVYLSKRRRDKAKALGSTSTTEEVLAGVNLQGKRILVTGVSAGL